MSNKDFTSANLKGFNIYYYEKGKQVIFFYPFTKKNYVIKNKDAKSFTFWQIRIPLCIILISILILCRLNILISFGIGIASYIISEFMFVRCYLSNLKESKSFKKPINKGLFDVIDHQIDKDSLINAFVLSSFLIIILIINTFINILDADGKILTNIFIVLLGLFIILILYCLYRKKKGQTN